MKNLFFLLSLFLFSSYAESAKKEITSSEFEQQIRQDLADYQKKIDFHQKKEAEFKKNKDFKKASQQTKTLIDLLMEKAELHEELREYEKAMDELVLAQELSKEIGRNLGATDALFQLFQNEKAFPKIKHRWNEVERTKRPLRLWMKLDKSPHAEELKKMIELVPESPSDEKEDISRVALAVKYGDNQALTNYIEKRG